jgi:hypothetical protein
LIRRRHDQRDTRASVQRWSRFAGVMDTVADPQVGHEATSGCLHPLAFGRLARPESPARARHRTTTRCTGTRSSRSGRMGSGAGRVSGWMRHVAVQLAETPPQQLRSAGLSGCRCQAFWWWPLHIEHLCVLTLVRRLSSWQCQAGTVPVARSLGRRLRSNRGGERASSPVPRPAAGGSSCPWGDLVERLCGSDPFGELGEGGFHCGN